MRYRILASFQGVPYEAGVGPDESDVVLFAACPPPEELRFEPATGHWRKRVSRSQVQTLYESRPVGMFRGEPCIVLDDLSDRLHIVYLGHDALRAAQLGYWEVDRGVFELITPRQEVTDIVEQRIPLPIRSDSGQHTRPGLMPSERPDDYGAADGNDVPYSRTDSQALEYGSGGHDEFATGPQLFDRRMFDQRLLDQRASLDEMPSSYSRDLPITSLPRSEPSSARPANQSDVAIPPVPEPPLPLEAEALRAASNAARRGQKTSQSRRPQPTVEPQVQAAAGEPAAREPQEPSVAPAPPAPAPSAPSPVPTAQVPVEPVPATGSLVQAAAPAQVPIPQTEVKEAAAEVSQPLPALVPTASAAAMLSKAAMLSHAAATAARQTAASSKQSNPPASPTTASEEFSIRENESHPRAEAELTLAPPAAQRQDEDPEPPAAPARISLGPEPASQPAEPMLLAPEPTLLPSEPGPLPPEFGPLPPELGPLPPELGPLLPELGPLPPEPAPLAPAPELGPLAPEPAPLPPEPALLASAPEPPALLVPEPVQVAPGPVQATPEPMQAALEPVQVAPEQVTASEPVDAPVVPADLAPPSPGQDKPTSPELPEPEPAPAAETAPAEPSQLAPSAPPAPAPPASAQSVPSAANNADGNAGPPLVGISDPPSIAHPPAAPAVPSWTPQGPVQPQADFDAVQPAQPAHDIAPSQAGHYASYVASEPVPRNGTATANGVAAAVDLGLITPMPIQQPYLPPPSTLPAEPEPSLPVDQMPASAADAEADPGSLTRRRRSTKRRLPTQKIFSDLATQAAIPAAAYAIGEEVDGAMCLVRTDEGFEVFNAAAGARHEVRVFQDEESAYFYLFGVLVAESVRTGALVPRD